MSLFEIFFSLTVYKQKNVLQFLRISPVAAEGQIRRQR